MTDETGLTQAEGRSSTAVQEGVEAIVSQLRNIKPDSRHPGRFQLVNDAASILEGLAATAGRCRVTGNPVGSDTWPVGLECPCGPCQTMVHGQSNTRRALAEAKAALIAIHMHGVDLGLHETLRRARKAIVKIETCLAHPEVQS